MVLENVLSYFYPQCVYRGSSKYNSLIRVNKEFGRYKLLVDGSRQSGEYIEFLWNHAFDSFVLKQSKTYRKILILGLGGGTILQILSPLYPNASIDFVEIDSCIIAIARDYFGIKNSKKVSIIHCDAKLFLENIKKESYDMIIVDLFTGRHIPYFVQSNHFIHACRNALRARGVLVINYLRELEYAKKSEILRNTLGKNFCTVRGYLINRNCFFFAQ